MRSTVIRAVKVACVITPILTVFNHYQEIVDLRLSLSFWVQVLLTFTVPYCVSTYSSAMASMAALAGDRRTGSHDAAHRRER